jgi:hypothetical protein
VQLSKEKLINIALVLGSVLVTYLIGEMLLSKFFLTRIPLNRQEFLSKECRVLAQSSKQGIVPQEGYIALLGDSYASGNGDWLYEADPSKNSAFHSAHLIHERTGIDVVSWGRPGRGSMGGMVTWPIAMYTRINRLLLFAVPAPKTILIYFYEGNDLNDNLIDYRRKYVGKYDPARLHDRKYFDAFLADLVKEEIHGYRVSRNLPLGALVFGPVGKYFDTLAHRIGAYFGYRRGEVGRGEEGEEDEGPVTQGSGATSATMALIHGKEVMLPAGLQAPSLDFTEDKLSLSFYILDRSLGYLCAYFPHAQCVMVYVPSPLSCYEIVSDQVDAQVYEKGPHVYPRAFLQQRSDEIAARLQALCTEHKVPFIDTRPAVRSAAKTSILHGPIDWKHFNKAGYTAFADAVVSGLQSQGLVSLPH